MLKYTTIIFDLDGTLMNTLDDLTISTNHALSQMGLPTRTIDEVRQFLGNGVRKLIEMAVPENTSEDMIERVITCFLQHYTTHCKDHSIPRKPSPAMVFEAIAQLGSEPEQCLYVGDSDVDILTARNAGIDCLSVTWGFKTAEFLSQFGATRMIDSPSEMLDVIKEG